jgi:23S rRNA (cytidine2498-2'-O)-methyltransferase
MAMTQIVLLCRQGFEAETAAEIQDVATEAGCFGYCKTQTDQAWVSFVAEDHQLKQLIEHVRFRQLIFARQWFIAGDEVVLDGYDRVSSIMQALDGTPHCGEVELIHVDTNEGKELSRLCKSLTGPLASTLRKKNKLSAKRNHKIPRLMILLLDGQRAIVGYHFTNNACKWPDGILHLKSPKDAPSRSTLKLEEAWHWFIPKRQWGERLSAGMRAVDLGAAPGGWTWQLVKRSMMVDAIDNGPMKGDLMESGQVTHHKEDGFKYHPSKKVHWMVCDMAESPIKVAERMAQWMANDWCGETVFNLKLPMKKRYQEVKECLTLMEEVLSNSNKQFEISAKHLYHDREEITCHIRQLHG